MRVRKKKNLDIRFAAVSDYIIDNSRVCKHLARDNITRLEIGCGKGRFAIETALANPDILLIAVEVEPSALIIAAEAAKAAGVSNLRFISENAELLSYYFDAGAVERIYLNFSDPWPRNASRRLTHSRYLRLYRRLLGDGGALFMKTDNTELFEWSMEQFEDAGWRLEYMTRDLHGACGGAVASEASNAAETANGARGIDYVNAAACGSAHEAHSFGPTTEYEQRFMSLGTPICALTARPPGGPAAVGLRAVSHGDAGVVAALASRVWGEHYTGILGKAHVKYMVAHYQSRDAICRDISGGADYRLLYYGGEAVGYMAVRLDGGTLHISKLYVIRELRGFGLGRIMLNECRRIAAAGGATTLRLNCNRRNASALAMYETAGFAIVGSEDIDIGGGFVNEDYVLELVL